MKIYTKTGDEGQTSLLGGTRVLKDHIRIEAYGTVDELNAVLGQVHDLDLALPFRPFIQHIQNQLFTIGSHLANDPDKSHFQLPAVDDTLVDLMEKSIDELSAKLPPLKNFVLPGGHPANSLTHLARCVCRRAERRIVTLAEHTSVDPVMIKILNRLSDWLFTLSRTFSLHAGAPETTWQA